MVAEKFALRCLVITPDRRALDERADSVILPAHDGLIGVLKDRAPLVCELGIGLLTISGPNRRHRLFVDQGFLEVLRNEVTVLTQKALTPEQIDRAQASRELEAAVDLKITDEDSLERRRQAIARAKAKLALVE